MKTKITVELNDFIDLKSNKTGSPINQSAAIDNLKELVKSNDFIVIVTTYGKATHILTIEEKTEEIKLKEL